MDDEDDQFWNLSSMIDAMGDPLLPLSMDDLLPVDDFLQPPPFSSAPQQQQPNIGDLQTDGGDGVDEQDGDGEKMDSESQQDADPADQQDSAAEDHPDLADTTRSETDEDLDVQQDGDDHSEAPSASDSDTVVDDDDDDDYRDDEISEPPEKKFRPIGQDFSDYGVTSTLETIASSSQGSTSTSHTPIPSNNEFYNMSVSFNNNGHYDNIISDFGNDIEDDETVIMSKIEEEDEDDEDDSTDDEMRNNEGAAESSFQNATVEMQKEHITVDSQKEPLIKEEIKEDLTQNLSVSEPNPTEMIDIKNEDSRPVEDVINEQKDTGDVIDEKNDQSSEKIDQSSEKIDQSSETVDQSSIKVDQSSEKINQDSFQDSHPVEEKMVVQDVVQNQEDSSQDVASVEDGKVESENMDIKDEVKSGDTIEKVVEEEKDSERVGEEGKEWDEDKRDEAGKENDEYWGYDSEDIDAMLEQDLPNDVRVPKRKRTDEESQPSQKDKEDDANEDKGKNAETSDYTPLERRTKMILKGLPRQDRMTESLLPPGWFLRYHESGMPLYVHRATHVATWSRPYLLGRSNARTHKVPEFAIPCLHWRKAEARKKILMEGGRVTDQNSNSMQCNNKSQPNVTQQTATDDKIKPNGASQSDARCDKDNESSQKSGKETKDSRTSSDKETKNSQTNVESSQKSNDRETKDSRMNVDENSTTQVPGAKTEEEKRDAGLTLVKDVDESISLEELKAYLSKVFEFTEIEVKKFSNWRSRRKFGRIERQQALEEPAAKETERPKLPAGPMLLSCKLPPNDPSGKKELVINAMNKSALVILHEYAQRVMKQSPSFNYFDAHNANAPFEVVVEIGGHKYGKGQARSKKAAKLEAAKNTLDILVPDIAKAIKKPGEKDKQSNLEYFDHVRIDDPRVYHLCERSGLLTPWELLNEYQQRNHGMNDMELSFNVTISKSNRSEYTIKYGPHEATGFCKNKRVGKQEAAQKILVKLHPYLKTWGALIKMYGRRGISSQLEEKKELRKSVIALQKKGKNHRNDHVLNKLKAEMRKLYLKQDKQVSRASDTVAMATDSPTQQTTESPQDVPMDTQDGAVAENSLQDTAPDTSLPAS